jgi:hypothetical protein
VPMTKTLEDRLDLSQQVLAGWSEMVELGATPVENLRLIENEIAVLGQHLEEDPERVRELMERWLSLAERLRLSIS